MNKTEYQKERKRIMTYWRQQKKRLITRTDNEEIDGFSGSSPLVSLKESLRQLQKDRNKELMQLERKFNRHFDMDAGRKTEFEKYERELASFGGSTDRYYRSKGYKNGKPNKQTEFVKMENGRLIHANICVKCGRRLNEDGNCSYCQQQKTDGWLRF